MSGWEPVAPLALLLLGVCFTISIAIGKLLKLSRLSMEAHGIDGVAKAIRKFLDREQNGDVQFYIRPRAYYDEIIPEEEACVPEACVVCLFYRRKDAEDSRAPLVVMGGEYIPLCRGHKEFTRKFEKQIQKLVLAEDGVAETPSE